MTNASRAVRLAFATALALMVGTSSALAAIAVEGGEEMTWSTDELVFLSEGGIVNPSFTCWVTIEGQIAEVVEVEEVVGDVDNLTYDACTAGVSTAIEPFGWDIYLAEHELTSETGGVSTLVQREWNWRVTISGVTCEYEGSVNYIMPFSGSPMVATEHVTTRELLMRQIGGSFFCPPRAGLSGAFTLDPSLTLELL